MDSLWVTAQLTSGVMFHDVGLAFHVVGFWWVVVGFSWSFIGILGSETSLTTLGEVFSLRNS